MIDTIYNLLVRLVCMYWGYSLPPLRHATLHASDYFSTVGTASRFAAHLPQSL
jgi:hypothetical protein